MRRVKYILFVVISSVGGLLYFSRTPVNASGPPAPVFDVKIPAGYRDWSLISVAHEEGSLNDLRAVLGNDLALRAYRENIFPFPDGAIIARLAWKYVPSEENNRVFGRNQSFVAGDPTNVQFMVKDSKRYAATGGWGFAQFNEGQPIDATGLSGCYGCHVPVKDRDFLFTRYAR
jgi:hypothetical protein